jgi:hypothetical protein
MSPIVFLPLVVGLVVAGLVLIYGPIPTRFPVGRRTAAAPPEAPPDSQIVVRRGTAQSRPVVHAVTLGTSETACGLDLEEPARNVVGEGRPRGWPSTFAGGVEVTCKDCKMLLSQRDPRAPGPAREPATRDGKRGAA